MVLHTYFSLSVPQGSRKSRHLRRATYPPPRLSPPPPSTTTPAGPKLDPLPPPLSGCNCSVCNAKQSLGALTLGKALKRQQTMNQHTRCVYNLIVFRRCDGRLCVSLQEWSTDLAWR